MKIAIRVDSSSKIGIGHLIRCRSLANYLKAAGHSILFICRDHIGNSINILHKDKFKVKILQKNIVKINKINNGGNYRNWLGVTQYNDANDTLKAFHDDDIDWLIVDHYGISLQWHRILRSKVKKIMVIDDIAKNRFDCDVLINQNYIFGLSKMYKKLINKKTISFLGPKYCILDPEYNKYKVSKNYIPKKIHSVFIYFGGEDSYNLIQLTINVFNYDKLKHLKLLIVLPQNLTKQTKKNISILSKERGNIILYPPQKVLAPIISKTQLAIGAGGTTLWERIYFKIPSIIISMAQNQKKSCVALSENSIIKYLGNAKEINIKKLYLAINSFIKDPVEIKKQFNLSKSLKIGLGINQIIKEIK